MTSTARVASGLVLASVLLAGCSAPPDGRAGHPAPGGEVTGTVTVFAAASLTEVFTELAESFEADHPGARVVFSFAGSSALATQVIEGAPADVYASASPPTMQAVVDADRAHGAPVRFARNQLAIAVEAGNPRHIDGLAALTNPALKVAVCAPQVPCGAATEQALTRAGVALDPVTLERDVKAALSKVTIGEADAALVYRTDIVAAAGAVDLVALAEPVTTDYLIVALAGAPHPAAAAAFVAHVRTAPAARVLTAAGFEVPG